MKNPYLAKTFKELAEGGKKSFYEGRIGKEIVNIVQKYILFFLIDPTIRKTEWADC